MKMQKGTTDFLEYIGEAIFDGNFLDVKIEDSWFKPYESKDGDIKPILFVNKATIITAEAEPKAKSKTKKVEAEFEPIDDGELPF